MKRSPRIAMAMGACAVSLVLATAQPAAASTYGPTYYLPSGTTYDQHKDFGGGILGSGNCYIHIRLDKPTFSAFTEEDGADGCNRVGARIRYIPNGVATTVWTDMSWSYGSIAYAPQISSASAISSAHQARKP